MSALTQLKTRVMNQEHERQLIVIGATADPSDDQLPLYLGPVCVDPDDPDRCYVANVAPWDGSRPRLSCIPRERFEEECDQGYWKRLEYPMPFAWDHRLVALEPDQGPIYLPDEHAYAEVERLGKAALTSVAEAIERDTLTRSAHERIWYAARALGDDPLPLLTAIALERAELPVETLDDLAAELPPQTSQPSALILYARKQGWNKLLALIAHDPLGHRYFPSQQEPFSQPVPRFLRGYPDRTDFLQKRRAQTGSVYARAA